MNPPPTDQPPLQQVVTDAYQAAMSAALSPSIANATPSYGSAPVHPPYAEMIMAAIAALKEVDGSSKKAIAKYIEGAYPNLPSAHPALLTHHLKRLKNCGQLVMVKKSYMLPPAPGSRSDLAPPPTAAAPPGDFAPSPSAKRRPGRPPKATPSSSEPHPLSGEISHPSAGLGNVSAKRRGRPPKPQPKPGPPGFENQGHQQAQAQPLVYAAEPLSSNNSAAVADAGLVNGSASLPKRRGRPPKYLATSLVPVTTWTVGGAESGGSSLVKKRPGRPPKAGNRPRGRPRKSDCLVAAPPPVCQAAAASSSRGRPRKRPLLGADGANVAAVGIRRRGRPKGVSGPRKLMIMRTGRPRGRPRKNALTVSNHASGQAEVTASVELTRKLEYMQLKVKNAVGLLKPHLINENIIDILTAIQDLEELAMMDIAAPTATATEATTEALPMAEQMAPTMTEQIAPTMAEETVPPTEVATPLLDLSAPPPAYPDEGAMSELPVNVVVLYWKCGLSGLLATTAMADTRVKSVLTESAMKEVEEALSSKLEILVDARIDKLTERLDGKISEVFEAIKKLSPQTPTICNSADRAPVIQDLDSIEVDTGQGRAGAVGLDVRRLGVNSVPYSVLTLLSRLDFPRFNGGNVKDWMFKCDQFIPIDWTPEEFKIQLASMHF
ncbi:hypothetical protein V2J09_006243 [Rumex salicifolius]